MKKLFLLTVILLLSAVSSFAQVKIKAGGDDDFSLRLIGRANVDLGSFVDGDETHLRDNSVAVNDVRWGIVANYGKWNTKVEICFTKKGISFRDALIGYKFNDNHAIEIGNQFMPFGAQPLGLQYKFVEDASADKLICPSRKIGMAYKYTSDPINFTFGVYSDGNIDNGAVRNQGYTFATKLVYRPICEDTHILHFGVAPQITHTPNSYSYKPIIPVTFVSANAMTRPAFANTNHIYRQEAEFIYINKKFYLEGHYLCSNVDITYDHKDFFCQSFYAQTSYLILGEHQNYNKKTGLAASASPKSLEILARYDNVNLDDFGTQHDFTLGLNYFFNKHLNMKVNYVFVKTQDAPVAQDCYNAVQARLQFSF